MGVWGITKGVRGEEVGSWTGKSQPAQGHVPAGQTFTRVQKELRELVHTWVAFYPFRVGVWDVFWGVSGRALAAMAEQRELTPGGFAGIELQVPFLL